MSNRTAAAARPAPGRLWLDQVTHDVRDLERAVRALDALGFGLACTAAGARDAPAWQAPLGAGRIELRPGRRGGPARIAFATPSAAAEHARMAAHGLRPAPPAARKAARETVVQVAPRRTPGVRVEFVEPAASGGPRRAGSSGDANRACALVAALVVAKNPVAAAARYARIAGLLPRPAGELVRLVCARGELWLGTRAAWRALLGLAPARAPALAGYALAVRDPAGFARRLARRGLRIRRTGALRAARLPSELGGIVVFGSAAALTRAFSASARPPDRSARRRSRAPRARR